MAIFLKLGDIKGESLDHKHQETLLRIDGDFLKLASANPDGSLKIDGQIKHDIAVISDSFLKLGQDFIKLSDVAIKIDSLFPSSIRRISTSSSIRFWTRSVAPWWWKAARRTHRPISSSSIRLSRSPAPTSGFWARISKVLK
jgi:hypothetical protein